MGSKPSYEHLSFVSGYQLMELHFIGRKKWDYHEISDITVDEAQQSVSK